MIHQTRPLVVWSITALVTTIWGSPSLGIDLDLYGVAGTDLLRIDPHTGGSVVVTKLGGACCSDLNLVGMDFDRTGELYGIGVSGDLGALVTIDASSGEVAFVGPHSGISESNAIPDAKGIAFSPAGELFVNTRNLEGGVSELVRVDNNLGIPQSSVPISWHSRQPHFTDAIEFSPDGTLYGGGFGGFVIIDPVTGAAEPPTPGLLLSTGDNLDFGPDGVLRSTGRRELTTIDLQTGLATAVGSFGLPTNVVALASRTAVPEPTSALLAIMASLVISVCFRLEALWIGGLSPPRKRPSKQSC